jgi:tetratricopeptide (TPR) repeat protein
VAERVSAYLASLQERLHQAKVEQAELKARAERTRRRLTVALASAIVLLVLGAGAAGLWVYRAEVSARTAYLDVEVSTALSEAEGFRQELHARLDDELRAPVLMSDLDQWESLLKSAREAWNRAKALAHESPHLVSQELHDRLTTVESGLNADEQARQLAFELDKIRFESSVPNTTEGGEITIWRAAPKLAKALKHAKYDIEQDHVERSVSRIRESSIRLPLVAALDFWALVTRDGSLRERLLDVARRADPDPWRDRVRQSEGWMQLDKLRQLTNEVNFAQQSPQLLAALSMRLRQAKGDAPELLRTALVHHPRDFWLYFELGHGSKDPVEQAGAFRAALSVRPESAYAYFGLGVVLVGQKKLAAAEACYRRAIALEPKYASAYNNLGMLLHDVKRTDEAVRNYQKAVELDDEFARAHANLGGALMDQGKLDEATIHCRRAVELNPNLVSGHVNLGIALRAANQPDEAVKSLRKAVNIAAENPWAWSNLGHVLTQQGNFDEGLLAIRRGHELGSKRTDWPAARSAEWVREAELRIEMDKKLPAIIRGELSPRDAEEQLALANLCVLHKKRFAAAARFFAGAFAAEPALARGPELDHRYNAACCAALAAAGQGVDARELPEAERARLRKQALDWLRAELKAWTSLLAANPANAANAARTLGHLQGDPDLASVRDEPSLQKLPSGEQESWRDFWADVNSLSEKARSMITEATKP